MKTAILRMTFNRYENVGTDIFVTFKTGESLANDYAYGRIIGESQIHEFGLFLDKYNGSIINLEKKFLNTHYVIFQPLLTDVL
ncbi:hypothetical protein NQ317_018973 [Molorchus minor]|uniref:Uncharacterized protein n=1 Tax=Molorchus minor TaxID=1323400 RepID=A0ABQ9IWS6_9CUCU|nr:hypothetical protein NQ317_018973 [Molorchus minor]